MKELQLYTATGRCDVAAQCFPPALNMPDPMKSSHDDWCEITRVIRLHHLLAVFTQMQVWWIIKWMDRQTYSNI